MKVFVAGATGFVGAAIADQLHADGHAVTGLARTAEAAERLHGRGLRAAEGDLDDRLSAALSAAAAADAIVFAAQLPPDREAEVVDRFLRSASGAFVFLSGTGVFMQRTAGAWSQDSVAEDDPFEPEPLAAERVRTETAVRVAASANLRAMVVRPPYLWGDGEHGHLSAIHESVDATGSACYVGEGLNCYTHLHVADGARLVAAALTGGTAGALYHGAAGEIPNRWLAEAVAAARGCTARSITISEATELWGEFTALIMSASSRCRAPRSRAELGWRPRQTDLLAAASVGPSPR